jgi:hypothetical protein
MVRSLGSKHRGAASVGNRSLRLTVVAGIVPRLSTLQMHPLPLGKRFGEGYFASLKEK